MMQHTIGLKSLPHNNYIFTGTYCNDLNKQCLIKLLWSLWTWRSCHLYLSIGKTQEKMRVRVDSVYQDCHNTFKLSERSLVMKEMLIVGYQTDSKFSNHHNRNAAFLLLMCGSLKGIGVFMCCHIDWTSTESYLQNTLKPDFIISIYTVLSLLLWSQMMCLNCHNCQNNRKDTSCTSK